MKRILKTTLCLWAAVPAFLCAEIKIKRGPYLQRVSQDEVTVVWTTDAPAMSWVEIAPDDDSHFYGEERDRFYQTEWGKKKIGTEHAVRISGLEKGAAYRYRIYSKEVVTNKNVQILFGEVAANDILKKKPFRFKTPDEQSQSVSFTMVNDIHADDSLFCDLTKNVLSEQRDFVVFNGDMLSDMRSEDQLFDGFLNSASKLFASQIPFYYVRGNHELRGTFSHEFMNYFPSLSGNPYYSFRQGPAFFIVLDGGEDKTDQDIRYYGTADFDAYRKEEAQWLKEVTQSEEFKQAPFKIVLLHMPPAYNDKGWHGVNELRTHFLPVLNEAGIDLMLCGHEHRLSYQEAGKNGFSFPVLINSNKYKVNASVGNDKIKLDVVDRTGKTVKTIEQSK
ncbi:MAG: metallophosphoesterase [Bacteroidales bacterium]